MNRVMGLKMSQELIKRDLECPLTFNDFKNIVDTSEQLPASKELEVLAKTELIYVLFASLSYHKIESYLKNFSKSIVSLCNSKDGYNALSKIISACLSDILLDVSRRVEIETMTHLLDLIETYPVFYDIFKKKVEIYLCTNICDIKSTSSLDLAENLKESQNIEQQYFDFVSAKESKEDFNEIVSRNNYNKKDSLIKRLRKTVLKNYNEESITNFINDFNKIVYELSIDESEKQLIVEKYGAIIIKLYTFAAPIWLSEQENREYKQITLALE